MSVCPERALERFLVLRPLRRTARGTTYMARDDCSTVPILLRRVGYASGDLEGPIAAVNRFSGRPVDTRIARWVLAGSENGALWTAQELPWGYPLDHCVRHLWSESHGMSVPMALYITYEVLRGLIRLHRVGRVHGDIAPEHVFLLRTGAVQITGAGEWPLISSASLSGFRLSAEHLAYRSKERLYVGEQSPEDDVFAVACLLYYMIAGRQELQGDSLVDTCQRVQTMDLPRLDARREDVPTPVAAVLEAVLTKGAVLSASRLLQELGDASSLRASMLKELSRTDRERVFDGSIQATLGVCTVDTLHAEWSSA